MGRLRRAILGISPKWINVFYKGQSQATSQLKQIGTYYVQGYNKALADSTPESLALWLNTIKPEFRGFAAEGVATGLSLLDYLTPWHRNRVQIFLDGPGAIHTYLVHTGIGWIYAWLYPFSRWPLTQLDPFMRWFVVDGYGCHDG
ncbi:MAG: DUF1702 family protein [bacterium]|nr:DUF1702 family protein [bacterium]